MQFTFDVYSKDEFLVVTFFPSEVLFRSSSRTLYEEKVRIYREAKTYCLVRFVSFVGVYTKRSHEVSKRNPVVSPTSRFAYTEVDSPTRYKLFRLH